MDSMSVRLRADQDIQQALKQVKCLLGQARHGAKECLDDFGRRWRVDRILEKLKDHPAPAIPMYEVLKPKIWCKEAPSRALPELFL